MLFVTTAPGPDGEHEVIHKVVGGVGSNFAVNNWDHLTDGIDDVDLLVVEYAVNDGFVGRADHLEYADDYLFTQQWYTEALIRKCLRFRNPSGAAPPRAVVCGGRF